MSTLQIRAHFLLYREWAAVLHGRTDIRLGDSDARVETQLHVELASFLMALVGDSDVPHLEALSHAILGLRRLDLLGTDFAWGQSEKVATGRFAGPFDSALIVTLSYQGLELYGWAQGVAGLSHQDFTTRAEVFGEDEIPRLSDVAVPRIQKATEPGADAGHATPSGGTS